EGRRGVQERPARNVLRAQPLSKPIGPTTFPSCGVTILYFREVLIYARSILPPTLTLFCAFTGVSQSALQNDGHDPDREAIYNGMRRITQAFIDRDTHIHGSRREKRAAHSSGSFNFQES